MIVRFLSASLLLFAAYACWWAIAYEAPFTFLYAFVAIACGGGLLFNRPWARYLWYAIAVSMSTWWIVLVSSMALQGWFIRGVADTIVSLLPGLALLVFFVGGSLAVRRHAMRRRPG